MHYRHPARHLSCRAKLRQIFDNRQKLEIYNVINNVCTFTVISMAKINILGFILSACSVGPK